MAAPEPGVGVPVQESPGETQIRKLQAGGFTPQEVNQYVNQQTAKLVQGGFKPSEIEAYWGHGDKNSPTIAAHATGNIDRTAQTDPTLANDPVASFRAGWGMSVTGLATSGKMPGIVMPEHAPLFNRIMSGTGQFIGDIPAAVPGFFGGAAAGTAAGAAVPVANATGVPEAIGGVAGAGFGAAAVPEGARQALIAAYNRGEIHTWQDAVQVVAKATGATLKAGVAGAVGAVAGGAVAGKLAAAGASELVSGGASAVANATAATAAGGAMDGHVPDAKDFEAGAIIAGLFHAGASIDSLRGDKSFLRVKQNLETIYTQTGMPPWEAAERATHDPVFRQEVMSQDVNGEPVTPNLRNVAPTEPPAPDHGRTLEGEFTVKSPGRTAAPENKQAASRQALPNYARYYAKDVPEAMDHLANLERSADNAISPAGAVGKYQIMPGTARAYMGKDFDVKSLFDPEVNRQVAERITTDLFKRYNGNMEAIAAAYNAGPKRASELLAAPPGDRLVAVPDKNMRGGYSYVTEKGPHAETGLPLETQRYLARTRLFMSGHEPEPEAGTAVAKYPNANAAEDFAAEGGGSGEPPKPPSTEVREGEKDDGAAKWWGKQNEDTLTEAMMRQVGEQPQGGKISLDRTLSQFVSELTPARRLDDRLIQAGEMDRTRDLGAEDMFRQTYASDVRAGVFVRYGAIDPITLDIKPGSHSVMDAARAVKEAGGNMDGWKSYMLAMRTLDKQTQGIDTGFNPKVAAAWDQPKFHKKYKAATEIFNDVMNSALEYSRDSGVHSQDQVDRMMAANPHYISMRRIMGDDEAFTGSGRGFQTRDALKKMEGSDKQIIDPIMATLDNMRVMIKMADRNRAIGHVIGMVERGEAPSDLLKLEDRITIKNPDEKTFKPYGLPAETDTAATYGPLIAERGARGLKDNQFLYFRNGQGEIWTAKDPLLAELMRKADSPGQANVVVNTFKTFASLERSGIVISPDFPTKVQLRHQITAFVMDPLHPPPFLTWLRGVSHVLKQDSLFQDAMAKGAMGVALADMDTKWLARDMHAVFDQTDTWGGVWNAVKHPLEFAQLVSERMDAAARVGYIKGATDQGIEPIKAATMSRKAYLDYAEKGTAAVANLMAQTIPFFRPHLLGMKQGWEAFQERPVDTLKYAAIGVTVPLATMYALNYLADKVLPDGQKYQDLPQWERDCYFITPPIAGVRLKLRLPPNVGFIMGGMMNRVFDAMLHHDPRAFDGWVQAWLKEYIPPLMPTVVQAPIEAITNHSFFSGKALIPASMEKASGYMQYTPYSSEAGKALSRALGPPGLNIMGMSPILFDHFVQGWGGTVGMAALHALDVPLGHVGKPWEVANLPFVGSFFVRTPGMSAAPIQQFYEAMDDLEAKSVDFKLAMKRAEGGAVSDKDIEQTAAGSAYAAAIAPIKAAISAQAQVLQGINDNKEMSAAEKRQATDEIVPQLVDTARQGLKAIDEIKTSAHSDRKEAGPSVPEQSPFQPPAEKPPVVQPVGVNRGEVPVS